MTINAPNRAMRPPMRSSPSGSILSICRPRIIKILKSVWQPLHKNDISPAIQDGEHSHSAFLHICPDAIAVDLNRGRPLNEVRGCCPFIERLQWQGGYRAVFKLRLHRIGRIIAHINYVWRIECKWLTFGNLGKEYRIRKVLSHCA